MSSQRRPGAPIQAGTASRRRLLAVDRHLSACASAAADESIPDAFMPETVLANSDKEQWLYREFHTNREPQASLYRLNMTTHRDPETGGINPTNPDHWYNTTGNWREEHWQAEAAQGNPLPKLTQDIHECRRDLQKWGYCLIDKACSTSQLAAYRQRLEEQAEAERIAGVSLGPEPPLFRQNIAMLPNKGDMFLDFVEMNPRSIQAGPMIDQLMFETLGGPFIMQSLQCFIAGKLGMPQGLHQDQPVSGDGFQTPEAPLQISAMVMISDVSAANGGTLLVPGSHKIIPAAGNRGKIDWLPPAINCTAPAGTCLIFDARVLHGTGVNTTDEPRFVLNAGFMRSYLRQQDNYCLGLRADVLARASDEALRRMGFQASVRGDSDATSLALPEISRFPMVESRIRPPVLH
jgi:ectoine hydroxylase-related dioxygenase (phytanoyl-CoA dioxygenase family)